MKNIKTKRGEFDAGQLLVGIGFLCVGVLLFLLSFARLFAVLLLVISMSAVWTSWRKVYYCTGCKNKHGEYPYNKCEKCGNTKFSHNINLK